ncbi:hypothetical protein [Dactylosporangium sp. NPDC048998]|uniref:hypothetical protein n=1 Tax=Dactylosporangium sp. NPDC048998 TaxID=3363976 RepID=UPI0037159619
MTADIDGTQFADVLETSWLVAEEIGLRRTRSELASRYDLMVDMLAEELAVMTLAACSFALVRWPRGIVNPIRARLEGLRTTLLQRADAPSDVLDGDQPDKAALGYAIVRLALVELVWRRLGFEQVADGLALRFAQMSLSLSSEEELITRLTDHLRRPGIQGFLANATLAERTAEAQELSAEMLLHGARALLGAHVGERLSSEAAVLALSRVHAYEVGYDDLLDYLLAPLRIDPQTTRLMWFIGEVSDEDFKTMAIWFGNIARGHAESADTLLEPLRTRGAHMTNPTQRQWVVDLLDLMALQLEPGNVDVELVIAQWQERVTSAFFPAVLLRLFRQPGPYPAALTTAAVEVLRAPETYTLSGIVGLTRMLVLRTTANSSAGGGLSGELDSELALNALKTVYPEFETVLPVDDNLSILEMLIEHDPDHRVRHRNHHAYWLQIQLELYEQRAMVDRIQEGRWALMFLDYVGMFSSYDLPAVPASAPAEEVLSIAVVQRLADRAANAIVLVDGEPAVHLDFLRAIRALFESQFSNADELEEARQRIDQIAQAAIGQLYSLLATLDSVPTNIKAILRRHREFVKDRLAEGQRGIAVG